MKILVDHAIGRKPLPPLLASLIPTLTAGPDQTTLIVLAAMASLVLYLLHSVLDASLTLSWSAAGQGMMYELSRNLFYRLQRLSLLFHQKRRIGDSLNRLTGDVYCIDTLSSSLLITPFRLLITLGSIGWLALQLNFALTILSFCLAPCMAASAVYFGGRLQRRAHEDQAAKSELLNFLHQVLTALPIVQVFRSEARNLREFSRISRQTINTSQRRLLVHNAYEVSNGLITTAGIAIVLYAGGNQVLSGSLTIGSLLVFLAYLAPLQNAFSELFKIYGELQSSQASLARVLELLEAEDVVRDGSAARPWSGVVRGRLAFEDVTFGYETGRPVLKNISLEIAPGETVALVGPTGSGKTTLISLIPRFYDPWEGRVLLDGKDLREIQLKSLRSEIALMPQDPFLLDLSVAGNISYGKPDATPTEIIAAAKAANADQFIRSLPEEYDSMIGEGGASLSGGQKQRLAIARAILKDSPILLLDESTSALDAETESEVMTALQHLQAGRTTIIIAHRLSTIRNADRVVVLNEGRILATGTHQQVLEKCGLYRQMHRLQFFPSPSDTSS